MIIKFETLLKSAVRDNPGIAVSRALQTLGFDFLNDEHVRIGKWYEIDINDTGKSKEEIDKLLGKIKYHVSNEVMEDIIDENYIREKC